jgi:uncharacterized membrane protein YfcA
MNAKTGFWSAFGALAGGALGAVAGKYAVQMPLRYRYAEQPRRRGEVEDAMVIGGAAGAMIGSFFGAAVSAPEESPQLSK